MTFSEWTEKVTGQSFAALKNEGTTTKQRYRLYEDYESYCEDHQLTPKWDF